MPSLYGEREIDLVLNENTSPELRSLHASYGDVLTMMAVSARALEQDGLRAEATALRERRKALDCEFALAMRKRAAGGV